jgi:tRNA nucleotidyltransferase (CCA-adding enzyme)
MDFEVAPPDQVLWIWRTLEEAGFETWIVGGAIRDLMLGRPADDWDFATRAHPDRIMGVFRRTVPIGLDHGTVGVLARDGTLYEVTTFRRDVKTFGRRAVVEFADNIEEDLSRRDFTVNALAWHPGRAKLLDPWSGARDLSKKILRTVGDPSERFAEDLLRVLRALRFAGQLRFKIEAGTWRALLTAVPELSRLSPERVQEEMMKVLRQAQKPSIALTLYSEAEVFEELYPEIERGLSFSDSPSDSAEGGGSDGAGLVGGDADRRGVALERALRACDAVSRTRPLVRLSLLMALVSAAPPDLFSQVETGTVRENRTGERKSGSIEALMARLRFSNADTKRVVAVTAGFSPVPVSEDPAVLRRWLNRVGTEHFSDIARAWLADARAERDSSRASETPSTTAVRRIRAVRKILHEHPPLTITDLALSGSDLKELGLRPGPQFGEILRYLLERVLERPEMNNRTDLEALVDQGGFFVEGSPSLER